MKPLKNKVSITLDSDVIEQLKPFFFPIHQYDIKGISVSTG